MRVKKPVLSGMPVLDVCNLTPAQLQELDSAYDRLSQQQFLPFPQMARDPTRKAIHESIAIWQSAKLDNLRYGFCWSLVASPTHC